MTTGLEQAPNGSTQAQETGRLVFRNVLFLFLAQLMGTPLSLVLNALQARYLGPEEFGLMYLAWTFVSFGFLAIDWGQSSTLPAIVAKDRTRAGELLGSGLAWRVVAAIVVYALLALGCFLLGYSREFQIVLALVMLVATINTITAACQDVVRGFERTDMVAYGTFGVQLGAALFVIPTLLLGGRLRSVLLAQALSSTILLGLVWVATRPMIRKVSLRIATTKVLLADGFSFLFFGLAIALQPNVDGVFLSKLAPPDAVGWYAAARKIVGLLIFPASALIISLYPTLCRLHGEDRQTYRRIAGSSLRLVTVVVVPVAVASLLYADVAIRIFSRETFGPAADDLRVLSVFVLLVYFTMTMGVCLLASGRQRAWATIQLVCVAVSATFDPLLVPWFQARFGNGGLGVCATSVGSEVLMLVAGISLMPKGTFDRALVRQLLLALFAGVVMVAVARSMSTLTPFVAGPVSLVAYVVCLVATGGLDQEQLRAFRSILGKKFRR
jgi:O-antigen/teichoic acid export membrane protein